MARARCPPHLLGTTGVPTLCVDSSGSPDWLRAGAQAVAHAVPGAVHRTLEGGFHDIPAATLAPALTEFFEGGSV